EVAEDPRLVAFEPESLVRRLEGGVDEAVRLRDEGLNLPLALDDHRERRCLDATQRDDTADPRPPAYRRGAGRVHADEPIRLGTRARCFLERLHLPARPQLLEAVADRLLRHRRDP